MYIEIFAIFVVGCAIARYLQNWQEGQSHGGAESDDASQSKTFKDFQKNYLLVYLLAVASDWLQGPYVYALYSEYGYSKSDIGVLFIAGFGSSALFGTFVASVADKYGRKSNAIVFSITYGLSCITKHFPNYWILMSGRILGGIATSILFSAFEAWLVSEHFSRGYAAMWLSETFAKAQFGNGIVAIASGQVAGVFASYFGKVAPFDLSLGVLVITGFIINMTWTENYGDEKQSVGGGFGKAWENMMKDKRILLVGLIQSAFEGGMYTFVFMWTPAMQNLSNEEIPHGMIFSTFMVCMMTGSSIFTILVAHYKVEVVLRACFLVGVACFLVTLFSSSLLAVYLGFLAFEVICGIYFPSIGTMRSQIVPEETRSALMNFFRIPLNLIVVLLLFRDLDTKVTFAACASLMVFSFIGQQVLIMLPAPPGESLAAHPTNEVVSMH